MVSDDRPGRDAVVLFDNTGTLSTSIRAPTFTHSSITHPPDVPFVSDRGQRLVQTNIHIDTDIYEALREASSLQTVFHDQNVPLHVALSNTDTTLDEVRTALTSTALSPSTVCNCVDRAITAFSDRSPTTLDEGRLSPSNAPVGVQVVVDLDTAVALYAFGYATVPKPDSRTVVDRVQTFGYTPYLVSGDATSILDWIGDELDVPSQNRYPYQSALDKAAAVRQFSDETHTVMVGDYVNDRLAFQEADVSIFIDNNRDDDGRTRDTLTPLADHVVDSIDQVPVLLSDRS